MLLGFIIALSLNAISRKIRGPLIFGTILPMIVTPLVGSLVLFWMIDSQGIIGAPIIPWESIIQNNTKDPTNGVTIIGKIVPKIKGPLIFLEIAFKLKAIIKPNNKTFGVTNIQ